MLILYLANDCLGAGRAGDFDLIGSCFTGRIQSKTVLTGFQEVFAPALIQVGVDAFSTPQFRDAFFTAKAFQHNADFLFSVVLALGCLADVSNRFLGAAIVRFSFRHHQSSLGQR